MSRDKAKGIFKAAETKWTEETMHEYTDVVYDDLEVAKDYVIDSGSNSNGYWEKWNSGKMIQYGASSFLTGINEPVGNLYSTPDITVSFGASFRDFPYTVISSVERNDRYAYTSIRYSSPSGTVMRVLSPTAFDSGYTYLVNWLAIGRWK